jgi:hypothetical protein
MPIGRIEGIFGGREASKKNKKAKKKKKDKFMET